MPGRNRVVVVDDLRSREQVLITTAGGHRVVLDDNGPSRSPIVAAALSRSPIRTLSCRPTPRSR
jgi:hypothetical protein